MKTINRRRKSYSILTTVLLLILLGGVHQAQAQWTTTGNDISNTNSGNVGIDIGTTTPASQLAVGADTAAAGTRQAITIGNAGYATPTAEGTTSNGDKLIFWNSTPNLFKAAIGLNASELWLQSSGNSSSNKITFFTSYNSTTPVERMRIDASGNVGIGTANPLYARLHIAGNNSDSGGYARIKLQNTQQDGHTWWLYAGATGAAGAFGIYDDSPTGTGYRMFFDANGKIGIGTTSPQSPLHVYQKSDGAITGVIADNDGTGTNTGQAFQFRYGSTGILGGIYHQFDGTRWDLRFKAWTTTGTETERLTIQGDTGNVGIGNANPAVKLEVNGDTKITGDIEVTGNIKAKFQDVAEWVPATRALAAGTVVTLNPNKSNEVMASTSAYDTRVAGVVSERPGLSLGEAGKDRALVATTGRVKVMVDATKSPIHVGDLLVTSDEEGVAMKSEPVDVGGVKLHRPGTLIGKALEPLESGEGQILVLLSLQ